jgi:hypothetical protein
MQFPHAFHGTIEKQLHPRPPRTQQRAALVLRCKSFWLRSLGINRKLWAKCRSRANAGHDEPPLDFRTCAAGPRQRPKSNSVDRFLRWVYYHEAETLPDFPDISKEVPSSDDDALPSSSSSETADVMKRNRNPRRQACFDHLGFLVESTHLPPEEVDTVAECSAQVEEPTHLEVRWLSPTSLRFLFRQYKLFVGRRESASLGTFWARYRKAWAPVLRIRKTSQHGKCDSCEQLKSAILHSKTRGDAKLFQTDYDQRQREQFADRGTYYSTRNISEIFFARAAPIGCDL